MVFVARNHSNVDREGIRFDEEYERIFPKVQDVLQQPNPVLDTEGSAFGKVTRNELWTWVEPQDILPWSDFNHRNVYDTFGDILALGEAVGFTPESFAERHMVKAALETVLWAGASGEVNELAQSVHLISRTTRTTAEKLLAEMPQD